MYHFQTLDGRGLPVPSARDAGSVGHRGPRRPHRRRRRAARPRPGRPGCRGSEAGWSSTVGPGSPCRSRSSTAPATHHPAAMRDSSLRERLWVFTMQGEDLAQPSNRIDLDPDVRDAWGFPAGRVTYSSHHHELVMSDHAAPILEAVLRDAGAEWTITSTSPPRGEDIDLSPLGMAPASYHIMGTCRMGDDPATSVVDPSCGPGTWRTCSSPTRRCSRPRPATTPRSRSWRWPPGPPTCWRAHPSPRRPRAAEPDHRSDLQHPDRVVLGLGDTGRVLLGDRQLPRCRVRPGRGPRRRPRRRCRARSCRRR